MPARRRALAAPPVVYVQAGHQGPREPATGRRPAPPPARSAPRSASTRLAPKVAVRLRRAGVDARLTSGLITPYAGRGAAFVSLHHDVPTGRPRSATPSPGTARTGIAGRGRGAEPASVPGLGAAPAATSVSAAVERRSRDLAYRIAARYRPIYTPANGARGRWGGVQTRDGNPA